MSKWKKTVNKPQISEQFIQNEERRRQMIMEAAKRRRDKERKLQQLNEQIKKDQQRALKQHKQEKKDAYIKYLRNNMHDKYEELKYQKKSRNQEVKNVSKWRKKNYSPTQVLDGLGLEVQVNESKKKVEKIKQKPIEQQSQKRKLLIEQFEKEWNEDEAIQEMIGSKLIDSLDLDIATVQRGREYNRKIKQDIQADQEVDEVKNLIGYESILFSADQRSQARKKLQISSDIKPRPKDCHQNEIRKNKNEQETFNELKNKKQGKLLNWANQQVEEADDLFSHYSSKRGNKSIKQFNEDVRKQRMLKKVLDPIPEKKSSKQVIEKLRSTSQNRNPNQNRIRSKDRGGKRVNNTVVERPKVNRAQDSRNNKSQEKKNITRIRQTSNSHRSLSKEKQQKLKPKYPEKPKPKTSQNFKKAFPPVPSQPAYTVATHQQDFNVESFIQNDLINLNQEERKLQIQIRNIHMENKQKIKQVEEKHSIQTQYPHSKNLIKKLENPDCQQNQSQLCSQQQIYTNENSEQIENSIQRLDDLLLKREIHSREKPVTHITEESYPSTSSIIDPFSKPADFQKQILQLAENISRIEEASAKPQINGYGYKNKMAKKKKPEQKCYFQKSDSNIQSLTVNMPKPPILEYSTKNNKVQQKEASEYEMHGNEDIEDSLDTMTHERVQVNQKLKNLLFD